MLAELPKEMESIIIKSGTIQNCFKTNSLKKPNKSICCCCCSVTKSCPTFCDTVDYNTTGSAILHYLPEFAQIYDHAHYLWQRRQKYTMEKRQSLQQVMLRKLTNHRQKSETRTLSNTIHKNKLKMNWRSKCKTRSYKTLRGKHRQNTLWHKSWQDPLWPTSQSNGTKTKNKQMGPN